MQPERKFRRQLEQVLDELALLRDYVFESSVRFIKPSAAALPPDIHLTRRELECLKWVMDGKSSWEIASILSCSEATVNFHITNVRDKFHVRTRQQAVVKAISAGLIVPH